MIPFSFKLSLFWRRISVLFYRLLRAIWLILTPIPMLRYSKVDALKVLTFHLISAESTSISPSNIEQFTHSSGGSQIIDRFILNFRYGRTGVQYRNNNSTENKSGASRSRNLTLETNGHFLHNRSLKLSLE